MIHCYECELLNDYPCEKWGACPNDDDFIERIIQSQNDR